MSKKTYWIFAIFLALPLTLLAEEEDFEEVPDIFEPSVQQPAVSNSSSPAAPAAADARLDGIGIGPGQSFAVINGKLYEEGEEKEGIKVIQIRKREVDILMNGVRQTLARVPSAFRKGEERQEDRKQETEEEMKDAKI